MIDLLKFRRAVVPYLGQTFTPTIAAKIEAECLAGGDPISLETVGSLQHEGYTFQAERLGEVAPELKPLHDAQWEETEGYRNSIPFVFQLDRALLSERMGTLVQFTIRAADGSLAGHIRMYLQTSMHTGRLVAHEDTLFIQKAHRGQRLGLAFGSWAEGAMWRLGATEIKFDVKNTNHAHLLLEALGYEHVGRTYHKTRKDDANA